MRPDDGTNDRDTRSRLAELITKSRSLRRGALNEGASPTVGSMISVTTFRGKPFAGSDQLTFSIAGSDTSGRMCGAMQSVIS